MRRLIFFNLVIALFASSFGWAAPRTTLENPVVPGLPTKAVDWSLANHNIERRGFVTAPLNYSSATSPGIQIFYRFIPSTSLSATPTLIFMNGGPGYASSYLRSLNYDYSHPTQDALSELLKIFNVVLVDQRGTDGLSFPLDQSAPELDQEKIAKYFSPDHLALDHDRVATALIQQGIIANPNDFYILGHSFGAWIGASYIRLLAEGRILSTPKGIILSCGEIVENERYASDVGARPIQRKLSQEALEYSLRMGLKPFDQLVDAAKQNFSVLGYNPNLVHFAYGSMLGNDPQNLYETVEQMLTLKKAQDVDSYLKENSDIFNFLGHVLNIQSIYSGGTASGLAQKGSVEIPYSDWTIDPAKAFEIEEATVSDRYDQLMDLLRQGRIPIQTKPTGQQIRMAMNQVKLMVHYASNDAVVGADANIKILKRTLGEELAERIIVESNGGHRDIRMKAGVKLIKDYFSL